MVELCPHAEPQEGDHGQVVALPPRAYKETDLEFLLPHPTSHGVCIADMHRVASSVAVPVVKTQNFFHIGPPK